jgi:hypothetical protein
MIRKKIIKSWMIVFVFGSSRRRLVFFTTSPMEGPNSMRVPLSTTMILPYLGRVVEPWIIVNTVFLLKNARDYLLNEDVAPNVDVALLMRMIFEFLRKALQMRCFSSSSPPFPRLCPRCCTLEVLLTTLPAFFPVLNSHSGWKRCLKGRFGI